MRRKSWRELFRAYLESGVWRRLSAPATRRGLHRPHQRQISAGPSVGQHGDRKMLQRVSLLSTDCAGNVQVAWWEGWFDG